jgi:hypothetical protein
VLGDGLMEHREAVGRVGCAGDGRVVPWWVALVGWSAVLLGACSSTGTESATSAVPGSTSVTPSSMPLAESSTTSVGTTDGLPDPEDVPERITTRWAAVMSGPSNEDEIDGVAAGVDDSLWVTGKFEQTATLGGVELASAGRADIPIARFDRDGNPRWVQRFGGPGEDNFFDIDADENGAVATGWFEGTVTFGEYTLTSAGSTDCAIVAFDNDGDVRWARSFGGPAGDGCNEVVIHADGSVVTSLDTEGGWVTPAGPIPELRWRDTLLLRLDPEGEVDWARRVGGEGPQRGKALAVGPDGSVAFGGDSVGPLSLDGQPFPVAGASRVAWLSHWSPDGAFQWATTWGGSGDSIVKGLAYERDAVYAVGTFAGAVDIAGTVLDASDAPDLAVVSFDRGGALRWATAVTADEPLTGAEVVGAADGGVLFAGLRSAGLRFRDASGAPTLLDDGNGGNVWLAHYRPDGSVAFASTIAGTVNGRPDEIARSGHRIYLDIVVRGSEDGVGGIPIVADRKDGSVWALDLVDVAGR